MLRSEKIVNEKFFDILLMNYFHSSGIKKEFVFIAWNVYFVSYVDAYRMVAVQLHGTHTDLKNIIQQSGMKLNMTDMHPGEPNDETFVKQVTIKIPRNNFTCVISTFKNK